MSDDAMAEAAREVLETTVGVPVLSAHPGLADPAFKGLIAILPLRGRAGGLLLLCCPPPLADMLASGIAGPGAGADGSLARDALGELVNQIAGSVRGRLGERATDVALSLPVVVAERRLAELVDPAAAVVSIELEVPGGRLTLGLWPDGRTDR